MPKGIYKKSEKHLKVFLENGLKTRFKKKKIPWNKGLKYKGKPLKGKKYPKNKLKK